MRAHPRQVQGDLRHFLCQSRVQTDTLRTTGTGAGIASPPATAAALAAAAAAPVPAPAADGATASVMPMSETPRSTMITASPARQQLRRRMRRRRKLQRQCLSWTLRRLLSPPPWRPRTPPLQPKQMQPTHLGPRRSTAQPMQKQPRRLLNCIQTAVSQTALG